MHRMDKSNDPKMTPSPGRRLPGEPGGQAAGGVPRISSEVLFAGSNEIEIDHKGTPYRLRQTSLGKLILTK